MDAVVAIRSHWIGKQGVDGDEWRVLSVWEA
jgi:hypothetical protein